MEFDRCGWPEARSQKHSEGFEEVDGSGAIVVSTRRFPACGAVEVYRVHVGADDGDLTGGVGARDFGNDRGLHEAVAVETDGHVGASIR